MRPQILFIESTPEVARAVAAVLERHQFDVARVDDPRRAAQRVASEHFDVVVVEVRAVAGDPGLEFVREIHGASPHLTPRIVVISNDPTPSVQRELDAIGVCDVVLKPVYEEEILNAVRECLDRMPARVQ